MKIDFTQGKLQGVTVREDEPLERHTTYKIGGPADLWVEVGHPAALKEVVHQLDGVEIKLLGSGSNVLVSDAGFRGAVLKLRGLFEEIDIKGATLIAGAGASLKRLIHLAAEAGIGGFEFLEGIPGTVGGAMANNSGTSREGILERLIEAHVFDTFSGKEYVIPAKEIEFGYRRSSLRKRGWIIVRGKFQGLASDPIAVKMRMDRIREYRLHTQPLGVASAGSVFRNPPGDFAGRLIESVGLKGFRIGDAQFSPIHANFIVNIARARAQDVADLIRLAQEKVCEQYKITLEPEIEKVGVWMFA